MGKFFGSLAATYTFSPTEYTQTQIFYTGNDEGDRTKTFYEGAKETSKTAVKIDGSRIEFKLPGDEPTLVFEGTRMTATIPGEFVDVWEKVPWPCLYAALQCITLHSRRFRWKTN